MKPLTPGEDPPKPPSTQTSVAGGVALALVFLVLFAMSGGGEDDAPDASRDRDRPRPSLAERQRDHLDALTAWQFDGAPDRVGDLRRRPKGEEAYLGDGVRFLGGAVDVSPWREDGARVDYTIVLANESRESRRVMATAALLDAEGTCIELLPPATTSLYGELTPIGKGAWVSRADLERWSVTEFYVSDPAW